MNATRTLFVGIGSPQGDDQAGWLVADRLTAFAGPDLAIRRAKSPADLLDWLHDIERLIVCDACCGLSPIGVMRRWTWPLTDVTGVAWSGTHDFSLPAVLALAEQLDRLPKCVVIWGIEGAINNPASELSAEVSEALPTLCCRIIDELKHTNSF